MTTQNDTICVIEETDVEELRHSFEQRILALLKASREYYNHYDGLLTVELVYNPELDSNPENPSLENLYKADVIGRIGRINIPNPPQPQEQFCRREVDREFLSCLGFEAEGIGNK
jgi:hypothetical protein